MKEVEIYRWIITCLLGIVNLLFWARIRRIEKDIEENKSKSEAIEKNYLHRFEELNEKLNQVEKNIIREISELRAEVK